MLTFCMVPANDGSLAREALPNERESGECEALDEILFTIAGKERGGAAPAEGERERALEQLYDAVRVPVFAYALSLLRHRQDAEDVLHDTVLAVWQSAGSYESRGKPMAWILTIAKNLARMKLRERSHGSDTPMEDIEAALPAEESNPEDAAILRICLRELTEEEREILLLHAVSGLRHREIAGLLDKPLSTVLSKYSRALKKMRAILESGGSRAKPGKRAGGKILQMNRSSDPPADPVKPKDKPAEGGGSRKIDAAKQPSSGAAKTDSALGGSPGSAADPDPSDIQPTSKAAGELTADTPEGGE